MFRLVRAMHQLQKPTLHRRMSSKLRQRSVVSSFICTSPQSSTGLAFVLLKRSQDVSTYRGKWAVCSGSIDPTDASPQAAAKREIMEETKLMDDDICILRRGKPFSLKDEELQTEWTIHPFAWQLTDGTREITFDWEHTEYKFIKPEDLANYDHVPQLELGLARVMVSPETEKALAILRDDHERGAQALALKALEILLSMVKGNELRCLRSCEEFWRELRWRAWHLAKNGRPSMGAAIEAKLFKTLDLVDRNLHTPASEGITGISLSDLKSAVESVVKYRMAEGKQGLESIAKSFLHFVQSDNRPRILPKSIKIVTLSVSATIHRCLTSLIEFLSHQGMSIHITFLESRPNFEGVTAASNLLGSFADNPGVMSKLSIEIVPDASVATTVVDADYVIFGGDKVIPNGNISNKIGSCAAAVTAKALNPACKVVALFETDKITSSGFDSEHLTVESNDETEITKSWPPDVIARLENQKNKIKVKNEYFEWVPARYIDAHISEQGVLSAEDMERLGTEAVELEGRLFDDL